LLDPEDEVRHLPSRSLDFGAFSLDELNASALGLFRLLLPLGINLDDLETLGYGDAIGNVSALLLASTQLTLASSSKRLVTPYRPVIARLFMSRETRCTSISPMVTAGMTV